MKIIHIAIITAIAICLIVYYNTKDEVVVSNRDVYEHLRDSFAALEREHDSIFVKQDTFIYYEKIKFKTKIIAIDSLSFDSLFKLWTEQARQYKPLFDSTIN